MIVRHGDRGPHVASLQRFLIEAGHLAEGEDDGVWGPISAVAMSAWQGAYRPLRPDGIPGPATFSAIEASGWSISRLAPGVSRLVVETAERLGMAPAMLEAFRLVESGSRSNPGAMRFEPHKFLRFVPAADIPYTPSRRGAWSLVRSETDEAAFRRAYAIDRAAAVRSTSWGLFQVLGGHLLEAFPGADGEPDPETAVLRFTEDPEAASFRLVESWFDSNPKALEAATSDPPDLRTLVRYYNGPGKVDSYSAKLADAIARVERRA